MVVSMTWWLPMRFPKQLTQIRKSQGCTQQGLAAAGGLHINQVRRYEARTGQPTLEGLIKVPQALHVSLDVLVFAEDDRGPAQPRMRLLFEAIKRLDPQEHTVIRKLLEGMLVKYEARRWTAAG